MEVVPLLRLFIRDMREEDTVEIIGTITFYLENRIIKSQSDFDPRYFKGNKALASNVMEGLHYDFLHRMKEEKLVDYEIKENS